jgi:hypothetical protein
MPKETKFRKKTEKYVETGSYEGYSIQLAIDSGFDTVYSIELTDHYYDYCVNRFINNKNVNMLKGDSIVELNKFLNNNPNTQFTYWLDAHTSDYTPIMEELELILSRNVNDELIYIDDMRLYRNFSEKVNIKNIQNLIFKYKPNAILSYEGDIWDANDILIVEY